MPDLNEDLILQVHPFYPLCIGRFHNHSMFTLPYGSGGDPNTVAHQSGNGLVAGEYPTVTDYESAKANARRMVACWNACRGIPTETLEMPSIMIKHLSHWLQYEEPDRETADERDRLTDHESL